jgi:cyclopropane-fatty-acyl-phospholipid synthase
LEQLGYDERFRRLWTLYLAYCEAGFAERRITEVQMLFAKPLRRTGFVPAAAPATAAVFSDAATG